MKCDICGGQATEVKELRNAKYRDEVVQVESRLFRCESCEEGFVTPEQMRQHVRSVKDEVRKKHGLLSPKEIVAIREKLGLTQEGLEELLGTGPKVVVRWESGKVIQSRGHDTTLRLLDRDPAMLKELQSIQRKRAREQDKYEKAHPDASLMAATVARGAEGD